MDSLLWSFRLSPNMLLDIHSKFCHFCQAQPEHFLKMKASAWCRQWGRLHGSNEMYTLRLCTSIPVISCISSFLFLGIHADYLHFSIQPPGQIHLVYTPVASFTIGGHFYSYDSIHLTEVACYLISCETEVLPIKFIITLSKHWRKCSLVFLIQIQTAVSHNLITFSS